MRESQEWRDRNVAFQRLRSLLFALQSGDSPTILFVDQLHRLLGGDWERYPFDMALLLKRLLSYGEIQLWGACTLAEYRRTIERDAAMQRHFQEVCLPSVRALWGKG